MTEVYLNAAAAYPLTYLPGALASTLAVSVHNMDHGGLPSIQVYVDLVGHSEEQYDWSTLAGGAIPETNHTCTVQVSDFPDLRDAALEAARLHLVADGLTVIDAKSVDVRDLR